MSISGGTGTAIPANSRTVSIWGTTSNDALLFIGGGTTSVPPQPTTIPISGGTIGILSPSGTAVVNSIFGG